MQKLTHPITIFVVVLIGFILVFFKTGISLILTLSNSIIFASGVFFISFGLGLLFFAYLTSDSDTSDKQSKTIEKTKIIAAKENSEKGIKVIQKEKKKEIRKPSTEIEKTIVIKNQSKKKTPINEKGKKEISDFIINKTKIQKELIKLHKDLTNNKIEYEKGIFSSNLIIFFSLVVVGFGLIYSYLNFSLLNLTLKIVVALFIFILFIFILKYLQSKKATTNKIMELSKQIQNLEQTTKRFNIISAQNSNALKSTIESLVPENKEYIYKKILTKK